MRFLSSTRGSHRSDANPRGRGMYGLPSQYQERYCGGPETGPSPKRRQPPFVVPSVYASRLCFLQSRKARQCRGGMCGVPRGGERPGCSLAGKGSFHGRLRGLPQAAKGASKLRSLPQHRALDGNRLAEMEKLPMKLTKVALLSARFCCTEEPCRTKKYIRAPINAVSP